MIALPALTLGTAVAAIIGALGLLFLFNGFWGRFPDEVIIGVVLLLGAWAILDWPVF